MVPVDVDNVSVLRAARLNQLDSFSCRQRQAENVCLNKVIIAHEESDSFLKVLHFFLFIIYIDYIFPLLIIALQKRLSSGNAGVIDENVQFAVLFLYFLEKRQDLLLLGDIGFNNVDLSIRWQCLVQVLKEKRNSRRNV